MPPEHVDIEAGWLADELKRLYDNAHQAYRALPIDPECDKTRLYLAYIIKGSESLYTHYRDQTIDPEDPELDHIEVPAPGRKSRKRRGKVAAFLLGDS